MPEDASAAAISRLSNPPVRSGHGRSSPDRCARRFSRRASAQWSNVRSRFKVRTLSSTDGIQYTSDLRRPPSKRSETAGPKRSTGCTRVPRERRGAGREVGPIVALGGVERCMPRGSLSTSTRSVSASNRTAAKAPSRSLTGARPRGFEARVVPIASGHDSPRSRPFRAPLRRSKRPPPSPRRTSIRPLRHPADRSTRSTGRRVPSRGPARADRGR